MTAAALTLRAFLEIAGAAGLAHPETLAAMVQTESGFEPYAVGVNGAAHLSRSYATRAEAEAAITRLLAAGYRSLDVGAAQINTAAGHMQKRGRPVTDALDPRIGIRVGVEVLTECWHASAAYADEQERLRASLGCYNTGRPNPRAPYVQRVQASAEFIVPALRTAAGPAPVPTITPATPVTPAEPAAPQAPGCAPAWDTWGLALCNAERRRRRPRPPTPSESGEGAAPVPSQQPPEFP